MATTRHEVSNTPVNLMTLLGLADGDEFDIQNVSRNPVLIGEFAAVPSDLNAGHILSPNQYDRMRVKAAAPPYVWTGQEASIVVTTDTS